MTWLGKILAMMVMLVSLVWLFLTAQAFATRTNWKAEASRYEAGYKEMRDAREKDYRTGVAEKDEMAKQLAAARKEAADLTAQLKLQEESVKAQEERYTKFNAENEDLKQQLQKLDNNLSVSLSQVSELRAQNTGLEDLRVKLVRDRETAYADRLQATNERDAAKSRADQLSRQVEDLNAKYLAMRAAGGREVGPLERDLTPRAAPLPENVRGTVTDARENFVVLSIGLDAGLTPGATLDLSRLAPSPKYLGTVTVSATGLDPKRALATFTSASGRAVGQLRADERPRAGDVVGRVPK